MGNAIYRKTISPSESLEYSSMYNVVTNSSFQRSIVSYNGRTYNCWAVEKAINTWNIVLRSCLPNGTDVRLKEIDFSAGTGVKIKVIFYIYDNKIYFSWSEQDFYTIRRYISTGVCDLDGENFSYVRHSSTEIFSQLGWNLNNMFVYENKIYIATNGDIYSTGQYQNFIMSCDLDGSNFLISTIGVTSTPKLEFRISIADDKIYCFFL